MKTYIFNALCANNFSQINVITGHIDNILKLKGGRIIIIITSNCFNNFYRSIQKNKLISFIKLPYFGFASRVIYEFIYIPIFLLSNTSKNKLLVNFTGIRQFLCFTPQIIYSQNPMPLIYSKLNISFNLKLKQILLNIFLRLSIISNRDKDFYFFNSHYMKDLYLKNLKEFSNKNSRICFNPIKNIQTNSAAKHFRKEYPLKFVVVSSLDKYKNIDLLIKSFLKLLTHHCDSKIVIIGKIQEKEYLDYLLKLIPSKYRENFIIFKNSISSQKLNQIYKESFLYLSASICESFGLPAIEAQAFGTPSLVAPNTASVEIVNKGGLTCDFENINNLSLIIEMFFKNPDMYHNLSIEAIKNSRKYSSKSVSKPFINI